MEAYTEFAKVYDLFMDNVPYGDWCERITAILGKYGIEEGLVLDLGCGTGGMTELLAGKGFDMIGVDASADMLAVADEKRRTSGYDILYLLQDMREFELYGSVRAVVSVCDSLNYITEEADLAKVFRLVQYYLDPGGIFLFDMNTLFKYEMILGENTFAENRDEGSYIWENYYDSSSGINEYDLTLYIRNEDNLYSRYEETHFQKGYSAERTVDLLKEAGLVPMQVFDADTGREVTDSTQRVSFTAQKPYE